MEQYSRLAEQYKNELFNQVIPFWADHSLDEDYGGYFTCLDREGKVFDTDKFIWPQARQVWTFAMLYNHVEKNEKWLKIAKHGADFLRTFGRDHEGNWYFALNRQGQPLVQPYNIFSDCFAAMAFGQLAIALDDDHLADIALRTYQNILRRQHNPKGAYTKTIGKSRTLKSFALPMILSNLVLELEVLLEKEAVKSQIDQCVHEVLEVFYDPERQVILETVNDDGTFSDTFEGRMINPGHGIEAMWFIMDIGQRYHDPALIERASQILLELIHKGWDEKHGGIFYFLDVENKPCQSLEWDRKLWWVHQEALIACAMAFRLTQKPEFYEWYQRIHDYTWKHFPDPEYGEWYGYLNRQGDVLSPLKAGKWKGCFHTPRALYRCWQEFEMLANKNTPAGNLKADHPS